MVTVTEEIACINQRSCFKWYLVLYFISNILLKHSECLYIFEIDKF
jgi:hypothetical protein